MISADHASTELPAIEVGDASFVAGWLHTARAALFSPRRFYSTLVPGSLGAAYAFAVVSLFILFVAIELVSWLDKSQAHTLTVYSLLLVLAGPPVAAASVMVVLGSIWTAVSRLFGARVPQNVSLRAAAYLTSIAPSFGVLMVASGTAPESAVWVISWYLSMLGAYLFLTYATYWLARRDTPGPLKAGVRTWASQLACLIASGIAMAAYAATQR